MAWPPANHRRAQVLAQTRNKGFAGAMLVGIALIAIRWKLLGCQGLASYVANCPVTPQAPIINSIATPAPAPPKAALCPFPMSVSNPAPGAAVESPVEVIESTEAAAWQT